MLSYILNKKKKRQLLGFFYLLTGQTSCSAELSMKKSFITSGPCLSLKLLLLLAVPLLQFVFVWVSVVASLSLCLLVSCFSVPRAG